MKRFYHGGFPGLVAGELLVPSPPHVTDGCPICVARAEGRTVTVGEYRAWLRQFGERALPVFADLEGAPDDAPMDPPSAQKAVYVTTSIDYATWYAARSAGTLYHVQPIGELTPSPEDHFETYTVESARVVKILRRHVQLSHSERQHISRLWKAADERVDQFRAAQL